MCGGRPLGAPAWFPAVGTGVSAAACFPFFGGLGREREMLPKKPRKKAKKRGWSGREEKRGEWVITKACAEERGIV